MSLVELPNEVLEIIVHYLILPRTYQGLYYIIAPEINKFSELDEEKTNFIDYYSVPLSRVNRYFRQFLGSVLWTRIDCYHRHPDEPSGRGENNIFLVANEGQMEPLRNLKWSVNWLKYVTHLYLPHYFVFTPVDMNGYKITATRLINNATMPCLQRIDLNSTTDIWSSFSELADALDDFHDIRLSLTVSTSPQVFTENSRQVLTRLIKLVDRLVIRFQPENRHRPDFEIAVASIIKTIKGKLQRLKYQALFSTWGPDMHIYEIANDITTCLFQNNSDTIESIDWWESSYLFSNQLGSLKSFAPSWKLTKLQHFKGWFYMLPLLGDIDHPLKYGNVFMDINPYAWLYNDPAMKVSEKFQTLDLVYYSRMGQFFVNYMNQIVGNTTNITTMRLKWLSINDGILIANFLKRIKNLTIETIGSDNEHRNNEHRNNNLTSWPSRTFTSVFSELPFMPINRLMYHILADNTVTKFFRIGLDSHEIVSYEALESIVRHNKVLKELILIVKWPRVSQYSSPEVLEKRLETLCATDASLPASMVYGDLKSRPQENSFMDEDDKYLVEVIYDAPSWVLEKPKRLLEFIRPLNDLLILDKKYMGNSYIFKDKGADSFNACMDVRININKLRML